VLRLVFLSYFFRNYSFPLFFHRDIPVDFKYIADPGMHSMPAVTLAPNAKWLGCQSLDNKIVIFDVQGRFRVKRKKIFKGHMVRSILHTMGVGRGGRQGLDPPLDFENFSKKGCFPSFE